MNPAFSVILFTTLSGAGYGLWFWWVLGGFGLGLSGAGLEGIVAWLLAAVIGFVLVTVGLMSSVFHLGKPARAWRAFSQWRTSWLSREGVASLLTYAAFATCFLAMRFGSPATIAIAAVCVAVGSIGTVFCTAMIYASLKPVPAWTHRLVVPAYQAFALHTGGLLYLALNAAGGAIGRPSVAALAILATSSLATAAIKTGYWRGIDRIVLPSREAATALEGFGSLSTFERPPTEANYLTREMGFVLARKHSRKLRAIAVLLFAGVPVLALAVAWLLPGIAVFALWTAALAALAGAFVERWLFFAEAKHMVMLYY
jgi:DMSO reductase anchor subunit